MQMNSILSPSRPSQALRPSLDERRNSLEAPRSLRPKGFSSKLTRSFAWVAMLLLLATSGISATSFTFSLGSAAKTSAGVYRSDGTLVRTLWSGVSYNAGTHSASWDDKDDDGVTVPGGTYTIRLIHHNVTYTWEGVIGNTSASFTGSNIHQGIDMTRDIAFDTTGNGFIAAGDSEGCITAKRFTTSNPLAPAAMLPGETPWAVNYKWTATDGTLVYFVNSTSGWDNTSFVTAYRVSDNAPHQFSSGLAHSVNGWNFSVIDRTNKAADGKSVAPPTDIAVQQSGSIVAVAHGDYFEHVEGTVLRPGAGQVRLFDKTSGAFLKTISVTNARKVAFAPTGDLWVVCKNGSGQHVVRRYTNLGGTPSSALEITGFSHPVAIDVRASDGAIFVADGGTSQQIKVYSSSGAFVRTYGQAGGYGTDATVAYDKWYLDPSRGAAQETEPESFVSIQPDGTFWVRDPANSRVVHLNASGGYINQIAHLTGRSGSLHTWGVGGGGHIVAADINDATRVFSGWLEFKLDYSKPLQPGDPQALGGNNCWRLVKNWGAGLDPNVYDAGEHFHGMIQVATLTHSGQTRTYALLRRFDGKQEVMELPSSGKLRSTGVIFDPAPTGTWANNYTIYENGELRYGVINEAAQLFTIYRRTLTGINGSGNPSWGTAAVMASAPGTNRDPFFHYGGGGPVARFSLTQTNLVTSFRSSDHHPLTDRTYHLGAIKVGDNKWAWRASRMQSPNDPPDGRGSFASGGMWSGVVGRSILYYANGNGQNYSNQWVHFHDSGLYLGQVGNPSYSNGSTGLNGWPNTTMNATSAWAVKGADGNIYAFTTDERHHCGVHRWKISGSDQTVELSGNVSLGGSITLAGTGGPIAIGSIYEFEPQNALGKRLHVQGSGTGDGTNVEIWSASGIAAQKWKIIDGGNGTYELEPQNAPGKRLDIAGPADGANALLWTAHGGNNQKFRFLSAGTGIYEIEPVHAPGKRIDVAGAGTADGTNVQLWTSNGSSAQKWKLISAQPVPNGTYRVIAKHSGKALDVSGVSTADGAVVHQWSYVGANNQKWNLQHLGDGYYSVQAVHSLKFLEVYYISMADGADVVQHGWLNGHNQHWKIEALGSGYYRFIARHSGKVLEVFGGAGATGDGAQVKQWGWLSGDNQQWQILAP